MAESTVSSIRVRTSTKAKYDETAALTRLPLVEVADLAIDAFRLLTPEQRTALIERERAAAAPSAA